MRSTFCSSGAKAGVRVISWIVCPGHRQERSPKSRSHTNEAREFNLITNEMKDASEIMP